MSRLWGVPVFPGDPMSQSAASYQRAIDQIDAEILLVSEFDGCTVDRLLDDLEGARAIAFELMHEAYDHNALLARNPSLWMLATSVEEYERAVEVSLLPPIPTTRRIDYKQIKEDNPLDEYVGRFGQTIDRGRTVLAQCPGHDDRRPSLIVYRDTDSWWCPVCNKGGDIFHYEEMRLGRRAVPGEA